jgi:hypothetical protein
MCYLRELCKLLTKHRKCFQATERDLDIHSITYLVARLVPAPALSISDEEAVKLVASLKESIGENPSRR